MIGPSVVYSTDWMGNVGFIIAVSLVLLQIVRREAASKETVNVHGFMLVKTVRPIYILNQTTPSQNLPTPLKAPKVARTQ